MPSQPHAKRLLAVLALAACSAPPAPPPAPAEPAVDGQRILAHTRFLASDLLEGRGPGTRGEQLAREYIASQLLIAGCRPGGADGGCMQPVPILGITTQVAAPFVAKGSAGEATLQAVDDFTAVAGSPAATAAWTDAELVFVGYGIHAPDQQWDDFGTVDVRGKVLLVMNDDPSDDPARFGGKTRLYYGRWTYKYEEAARQGALGLIIVHETEGASYGWATVKNSNTNEMFDIVRKDPKAVHPTVEGWIQRGVAVELFKAAGLDFEAQKAAARTRAFKPVELKGVTLSADYRVKYEVIVSQNVVALLPGKTRPDETVMYTAHWDHIGIGAPDATGDRIYNGAIDNATGTAGLLELARLQKAAGPADRSIVFLWVTAEEKGLLGSEYYAANPLYPLATTAGVLNADGMNVFGLSKDFTISGSTKVELLDMLIAEAAKSGRTYTPDPNTYAGYFFRSDHFSLAKRGVPAISFGGGQDWVDGGVEAGKASAEAYRKDRYHQQADNFDPSWPLVGMAADVGLLQRLGRDLANATDWPEWGEGVEFKATRDATKAERK